MAEKKVLKIPTLTEYQQMNPHASIATYNEFCKHMRAEIRENKRVKKEQKELEKESKPKRFVDGVECDVEGAIKIATFKFVQGLQTKLLKAKMDDDPDFKDRVGDVTVKQLMEQVQELAGKKINEHVKGEFLWITVNAKEGVEAAEMLRLHTRLVSGKYKEIDSLVDLKAVLEHRWENPDQPGPHIHYFLQRKMYTPEERKDLPKGHQEPATILLAFKRCFKAVCDVNNKACLNVKSGDSSIGFLNYINGQKKDHDKDPRVVKDREYRKNNAIPDVLDRKNEFL